MKDLVRKTIKEHQMIERFDKVVVGVSGGHDSMTLLYVLESLKDELEFEIVVAHINHGIRGEQADGDEEYVRNISNDLKLPFYSCKVNMDQYAKQHKITSEEAGREIRYDFFRKILKDLGAANIAVAHNRNDQAETLIMRFMRGTGIDGLRGMEFKTQDIIRPLLDIERSDIEKYCEDLGVSPRIDPTNAMPIYGRNKVRLELLPYIEETFNSGIINTLSRTSEIMKIDSDFLMIYSEEKFLETLETSDETSVVLDIKTLNQLHESIKTRVIRLAIKCLNSNLKGIEKKHIEDILKLVKADKTGKSINITNNITINTSYNNLILKKNHEIQNLSFDYNLDIGCVKTIDELNSKIESKVCSLKDADIDLNNNLVKYFDYDNIKSEIHVRNRRNGDKFIPIGMSGNKKLKDFFIDEKIPKEKRDRIPLVLDGEDIMWVVGHRISEEYKVNPSTKNVLVLSYIE